MNLQELRDYLDTLIESLTRKDQSLLKARLEGLVSVFPFNEYEFILTFLVDRGIIHFSDYEDLREKYVSTNHYLDLFGLAPRIFGQVWDEQHLILSQNGKIGLSRCRLYVGGAQTQAVRRLCSTPTKIVKCKQWKLKACW